jgi:hypothetical protein
VALEHHRTDRVTERGEQDRERAEQLIGLAGDVDPDERDDAREPEHQAREPRAGGALLVVEPEGEQRDEQRRGGDDDRGQRRGDVLLARRDQRERQRHLDHPEDRDPQPAATQRP